MTSYGVAWEGAAPPRADATAVTRALAAEHAGVPSRADSGAVERPRWGCAATGPTDEAFEQVLPSSL